MPTAAQWYLRCAVWPDECKTVKISKVPVREFNAITMDYADYLVSALRFIHVSHMSIKA